MPRTLAIGLLALLLCGCVPVGSDKPLFSAADAGGPGLRPGLWSIPNDKCVFDPATPVAAWPSCANATEVRDGRLIGGFGKTDGPAQSLDYVLSTGDPAVVQLKAPPDRKATDPEYVYFGLEPTQTDKQGRAVEAHVWMVLCFKPPLDKSARQPAPYPGLTMHKGDGFCRAVAPGPVRNAARLSRDASVQGDKVWLLARWLPDPGSD